MREYFLLSVVQLDGQEDWGLPGGGGGGPGRTKSCWTAIEYGVQNGFSVIYLLLLNSDGTSDSWATFLKENLEYVDSATGADSLFVHNSDDRANPEIRALWEDVRLQDPVVRRDWHMPAVLVVDPAKVDLKAQTFESTAFPLFAGHATDNLSPGDLLQHFIAVAREHDTLDALTGDLAVRLRVVGLVKRAHAATEVVDRLRNLFAGWFGLK